MPTHHTTPPHARRIVFYRGNGADLALDCLKLLTNDPRQLEAFCNVLASEPTPQPERRYSARFPCAGGCGALVAFVGAYCCVRCGHND